jgi:hypothetical protein
VDAIFCNVSRPIALSGKGNAEREGFEPSWRVSPPTAFPGLGSQVQGGALAGTAYSESHRRGHRRAGAGTRLGSALGLVSAEMGLSSRRAERTFTEAVSREVPIRCQDGRHHATLGGLPLEIDTCLIQPWRPHLTPQSRCAVASVQCFSDPVDEPALCHPLLGVIRFWWR